MAHTLCHSLPFHVSRTCSSLVTGKAVQRGQAVPLRLAAGCGRLSPARIIRKLLQVAFQNELCSELSAEKTTWQSGLQPTTSEKLI